MLAARNRLREATQFAAVTRGRRSVRSGGRLIVVHLARTADANAPVGAAHSPRAGFAVSRSVGNAVVRNRTKRRLRAQTAQVLERLPDGVDMVVRALPGAGCADSAGLGAELRTAVDRGIRRLDERCPR